MKRTFLNGKMKYHPDRMDHSVVAGHPLNHHPIEDANGDKDEKMLRYLMSMLMY